MIFLLPGDVVPARLFNGLTALAVAIMLDVLSGYLLCKKSLGRERVRVYHLTHALPIELILMTVGLLIICFICFILSFIVGVIGAYLSHRSVLDRVSLILNVMLSKSP